MRKGLWMRLLMCFLAVACAPGLADAAVLDAPGRAHVGEAFVVEFASSKQLSEVRLSWLGEAIELRPERIQDGWRAVALLGSDVKTAEPGSYEIEVTAREGGVPLRAARDVSLVARDYPEQRLTLPEKMVSPWKEETLERIRAERRLTDKALAARTPERFWRLPFTRPVSGGISSVYGLQRFLNDKPRSPHRGIDFRGKRGTYVGAVANGRVILTGEHYFAGKSVYVDHGQGVVSMYFHLSEIRVRQGEMVAAGDAVGRIGSTGRVTGPHLHFGLSVMGASIDPMPLFDEDFGTRETNG